VDASFPGEYAAFITKIKVSATLRHSSEVLQGIRTTKMKIYKTTTEEISKIGTHFDYI
jgi:hypothetical protein